MALEANPEVFDAMLKTLTIVVVAGVESPHEYNLNIDSFVKK